jgi:DNA-binding response OmpR family regulator
MLRLRKALAPHELQFMVQTVRGLGYRLSRRAET